MKESRFLDAPWFKASQTQNITLGGVGGIGSWLALFLARIGYTSLAIFDYDKFEEHNLGGQLVRLSDIERKKIIAVAEIVKDFTGKSIMLNNEYRGYNSPIMFSAFDNMKARKLMIESWLTRYTKYKEKPSIFIDGRLLFEQIQIFCITTPEQAEEYLKNHIVDDSTIPDEVCTLKQTSHTAAMIASMMVAFYTNYLSNVSGDNNARSVPFFTEYFIPLNLMTNEE
jgi:hypothetical protein